MLNRIMGAKKDTPANAQKMISEMAKATKFTPQQVEELCELFMNISDSSSTLDKPHFQERLGLSGARKTYFVDRLYEQFRGKESKITLQNFVSNLNVILHGDAEERSKFCFKMWDADGSDSISRAEMRSMVESNIDCGLALSELVLQQVPPRAPQNAKRLEVEARVGASGRTVKVDMKPADVKSAAKGITAAAPDDAGITRLADTLFDIADTNKDGKVNKAEFRAWITKDPSPLKLLEFYGNLLASQMDPATMLLRNA